MKKYVIVLTTFLMFTNNLCFAVENTKLLLEKTEKNILNVNIFLRMKSKIVRKAGV